MKKHLSLIILVCFGLVQGVNAQTQSNNKSLGSFVGKYQFKENKMTFLQITLKDNQLVLKQLWDNQEIPFKQTGSLTFYNDEKQFPLIFTKNDKGNVTQVLAFDRDVWNKVADDYVPEMQKIIHLDQAELKACEGKYRDGDGDDFLQITTVGDHLILKQLWDGSEVQFWPIGDLDFFNDKQTFSLKFIKGTDGNVNKLVAKGTDNWFKVK